MSDDEDRLLAERAQAGDDAAFAALFQRLEPDVVRLCRRMLGDAGLNDARNEVFLRSQRGVAGYDPGQPFRRWLLAIAGHHCIDLLRRRNLERRLFDGSDLDAGDLADPGLSPLRQIFRAEQRTELLDALDELPLKYRLPLVLRYFHELDYAAMADVLAVTRAQVGTLLFRAKRRLRERIAARSTPAPDEDSSVDGPADRARGVVRRMQ